MCELHGCESLLKVTRVFPLLFHFHNSLPPANLYILYSYQFALHSFLSSSFLFIDIRLGHNLVVFLIGSCFHCFWSGLVGIVYLSQKFLCPKKVRTLNFLLKGVSCLLERIWGLIFDFPHAMCLLNLITVVQSIGLVLSVILVRLYTFFFWDTKWPRLIYMSPRSHQ